jgi:MFS transporter, UMF1 family
MNFIKEINKENLSWALYDWANSAYATTVMAVFFPVFFNEFWSLSADTSVTTARLGFANSAAGILMLLLAPVIGTLSDISSAKKKYLFIATVTGAVSSAALFFIAKDGWISALALYAASSVSFSAGIVFYDSLLKNVAGDDRLNFVSALGYSLGYLGGGILLAMNIFMTLNPGFFGLASTAEAVRVSFVSVGVWWILFSVPLFLFVKESPKKSDPASFYKRLKASLTQLKDTFAHIKNLRSVYLFLIAYWLYIDGVDTIIRMAMDFGISIGFDTNSLIKALLITQFVGFPAALFTGMIFKGKDGAKKGIFLTILVYLGISVFGAFMSRESHFYILAVAVGLVQGGIQSLSRSYFAYLVPKGREGEFFGFFNMIGKFAVILGPLIIGITGLCLRSAGFSADASSRGGILSVSLFFIFGAIVFRMSSRDSYKT